MFNKNIALQMNRATKLFVDSMTLTESQSMEIADLYDAWEPKKNYKEGKILKYGQNADGETQLYYVLQNHPSTAEHTPDIATSLYKKIGFAEDGKRIWTQPLGATDAYDEGDEVWHNDEEWVSEIDANVWEPGVYGWRKKKGE